MYKTGLFMYSYYESPIMKSEKTKAVSNAWNVHDACRSHQWIAHSRTVPRSPSINKGERAATGIRCYESEPNQRC